jgi:endonuclease/exonuclease/phosphatase family metal-dependent hydrolase
VLKIASYNVLNLFDAVDDPYHNDDSTGPKPRAEMERVAKQIRELDADIVALQEVENRGYLERFVSVFLADMGYQVVLFEGNDKRGIDVAVLSRLPVGPVTSYRHVVFPGLEGEPMRMRRDLIQVLIEPTNGDPFDVFVVHLKSKGGAPDGGREIRLPESRNVRAILEDILKDNSDARFVICGDFNDTLDSEAVQTIIGHGATALTQFVGDLTPNTPATYNKEPYLSTIDFIFASPEMAKQYVDDSYKVMPGSVAKTGSDHNAVVAKFRVK